MKWLARVWNAWVELVDKIPKRPEPPYKITLEGLRWDMSERVRNRESVRFGCGLHLTHRQVAEVLEIIEALIVKTQIATTHREQRIMRRLQEHNVALPPYGCTWDRCMVPCESQTEHDAKDFTGITRGKR